MKEFEFASPRSEAELIGLLAAGPKHTELLAGGTDLVGLLQKSIVEPERVVNLLEVRSLRGVSADSQGVTIGAVTSLEDVAEHPAMQAYPGVLQAIAGINSQQLQAQGTLGGELCQRPRCWYFRNGHGLLAQQGREVAEGENRYHAILGNAGPAKFVSASRIAPALIALDARVRILGPREGDEAWLPLEFFFRTPKSESQRETTLEPSQVLTHIALPAAEGRQSATYEVRQSAGPDYPLASAACALTLRDGLVEEAKVVLGHVAPTPWVAPEAARVLSGQSVTVELAEAAGEAALAKASPLSENGYKVQLARVAVKRAVLLAAGLETGGF